MKYTSCDFCSEIIFFNEKHWEVKCGQDPEFPARMGDLCTKCYIKLDDQFQKPYKDLKESKEQSKK